MMRRTNVNPRTIGALYVGSESHPYAVKPTGTIVAEAIEASPNLTVADFEFACKAGTAAIQTCMGLVGSGMVKYGVAIGADTSQGAPGDALEYSASAGGAAYLIGSAEIDRHAQSDLLLHHRHPGLLEAGRAALSRPTAVGSPASRHTSSTSRPAGKGLMEKVGDEANRLPYAVFHQPNGKFPMRVAKQLGFTEKQIEIGLLTPVIGNTYSGAVPLGLAAILDVAKPGDRIFVVAYGSGAGADGFDITVTDNITQLRPGGGATVKQLVENKKFIDYATYAKFRGKIQHARRGGRMREVAVIGIGDTKFGELWDLSLPRDRHRRPAWRRCTTPTCPARRSTRCTSATCPPGASSSRSTSRR